MGIRARYADSLDQLPRPVSVNPGALIGSFAESARRPRVLVAMDDTLLSEALVEYLGKLRHLDVRVLGARAPDLLHEVEAFTPQAVLVDRHPSGDMLRLAARLELRVAVVTLRERAMTVYEVWCKEVGTMQEVVSLLDQSWQ